MFLYEGDCLKNVTVIRGVRYVTVSHYSGNKDVCDKLGELLTDAFRSCDLHGSRQDLCANLFAGSG